MDVSQLIKLSVRFDFFYKLRFFFFVSQGQKKKKKESENSDRCVWEKMFAEICTDKSYDLSVL